MRLMDGRDLDTRLLTVARGFRNFNRLTMENPGGAEGNRTPDLLNAIQALSQLSYSPEPGEARV